MPQLTPFDHILAQCRDLFCERLASALAGMLDKAGEALTALESETRDAEAQALYRDIRDKLLPQREKFEAQFRARYLREFQQRSNRAKRIGDDFADVDLPDVELALVGEDDLNETLKFNAMTARLRQYCEEELVALDQRVGVLFGDAGLQSDDNPFTPQAISDAYKLTCGQADANVEARLVLLKLFDEFVLDEIRGIYRAVNALMVQNSILPKLRGVGSARRDRAKTPPAETKSAEQDLFALLQNLMGKGAAGAASAPPAMPVAPAQAPPVMTGTVPVVGVPGVAAVAGVGPQVLQGGDLMRSLTRVQLGDLGAVTGNTVPLAAIVAEPGTVNVLRELKSTNLGSDMSQMDAMTLDIVAMLFDQLFDDPKIPIGVKGLIGRLQIPFLKVAIADKAFFTRKTHPARQMLDTLGEVAARLPADVNASNPTFVRLQDLLQGLLEGFEADIAIFDTVREKLDALVTEEDQRIEQQAQADEKQVEQKESLALAKTVAQTEIKMRLRASRPPRPVLEFLLRQWIKVLLLIQVKEGEYSESWKNALETMDLLIWSVEPRDTREERRELVAKVPGLLKRLSDALVAAGIEDAIRSRFIADLRKLHSEIIAGNGAAMAATTEPESPPADVPEQLAQPAAGTVTETAVPDLPTHPAPPPVEVVAITDLPSGPALVPEEAVAVESAPSVSSLPEALAPEMPAPGAASALTDAPPVREPAIELVPVDLQPAIAIPPEPPPLAIELPAPDPVPEASPSAAASKRGPEPPAMELAPVAAPAEPTPVVEVPALDFAPVTPAAPVEPKLAFELPPLEAAPAPVAKPAEPVPALDFPALDFAAAVPAASVAPKPVVEPPKMEKRQPAAAVPAAPVPAAASRPAVKPPPVAVTPDKPQPPAARPPAPRPAAVAARPAELESLDMTAPVTVPNPFGEGQVEVNDLDFTVQVRASTAGAKPVSPLPPEMKLGAWVDIVRKHGKEKRQTAKLTFISPLKTRYLFADRHGKTALECSQAELVRLLQLGEVALSKEPTELPLFDRLAEGLVGKLGQRR